MARRLAAILAADVVGFSRLMGKDEAGTLERLRSLRKELMQPTIIAHGGRIVKLMGDGLLAEFPSAVEAVKSAVDIQQAIQNREPDLPDEQRIALRIGINLGDIIVEGSDIYGDGVNVAARLEGLAEPGGICLSGPAFDMIDGKLEIAFEDAGEQQVKNIAKPVRVYRLRTRADQDAPSMISDKPLQASDRPSVAVLPFDNMSGDPAQQYLSDGITEDIITELARFRGLTVAARLASAQFGGKSTTINEVRRALGVDYVVEGSLRRIGDQIRITVQLIDAASGNHLWAERYQRQVGDIFAVLDEVIAAIISNLEDRIASASAARARRRPTESWTAYDFLLQGRELCNFHREPDAIQFFEHAIAIDPSYALAHAWLGLALVIECSFTYDFRQLGRATEATQRALALDPNEPAGHWAHAIGLTWKRRYEAAGNHFDRAIMLNPADPQIRADWANWLRYCGRCEDALVAIDQALRQAIFAPNWFHAVRGRVLFDLGRYAEAIVALDNLTEKGVSTHVYLTAAHSLGGDEGAAAEAIAAARQKRPTLSLKDIEMCEPYKDPAALQRLLDGLRQVGLEQ